MFKFLKSKPLKGAFFVRSLVAKGKAVAIHLLVSVLVVLATAFLVFCVWYPFPYYHMAHGLGLWLLIVGCEFVLGPMMSFVIYNPAKSRKELFFDYTLVALIQLSALAYGLYSVAQARPIAMVFVKDRFELITFADFSENNIVFDHKKFGLFSKPKMYGIDYPSNIDEKNAILFEVTTGGRDYHLRPELFIPLTSAMLLEKGMPVAELCNKNLQGEWCGDEQHYLRWLPMNNAGIFSLVIYDLDVVDLRYFIDQDPWQLYEAN